MKHFFVSIFAHIAIPVLRRIWIVTGGINRLTGRTLIKVYKIVERPEYFDILVHIRKQRKH